VSKRQADLEQTALPHTGSLLRFARRLTGNVEAAEDLVQESLEVRQAVEAVPEDQYTVILLAVVEGFSCNEAAEILSIPVGTVMSRRARQALREKLTLEHKNK
jgi:RNA polymerase sigma-70 factor (ECF subfamily)